MRSVLLGCAAALLLAASGCDHHNLAKNGCNSCQQGCGSGGCASHGGHGGNGGFAHAGYGHGHGGLGGGAIGGYLGTPGPTPVGRLPQGYLQDNGPAGPPTATYAYPYYTTRAPRDFLMDNPPSIGY